MQPYLPLYLFDVIDLRQIALANGISIPPRLNKLRLLDILSSYPNIHIPPVIANRLIALKYGPIIPTRQLTSKNVIDQSAPSDEDEFNNLTEFVESDTSIISSSSDDEEYLSD